MKQTTADPEHRAEGAGRGPIDPGSNAGSMTGWPRWAIALIGLAIGAVAATAAILLVGAASLCGFDENQELKGYCAAGDTMRFLVVAIPAATVLLGYLLSLRTGRLTPIAVAALCAIAEGLAALGAGY